MYGKDAWGEYTPPLCCSWALRVNPPQAQAEELLQRSVGTPPASLSGELVQLGGVDPPQLHVMSGAAGKVDLRSFLIYLLPKSMDTHRKSSVYVV